MSKVRNLIHIVFSTRKRHAGIPEESKLSLYAYILTVCQHHQCFLLRIGGVSDHIHMLIDLNPMVALSDFMRTLKRASSAWLKNNDNFPDFKGWNEGYYAFSISEEDVPKCIEYIKSQPEHHKSTEFIEETKLLAADNHISWHPLDW